VVALCAPEAVLELGQALVLAEAVKQRRRADRRDVATAEARHLQDVPGLQVAKPDGVSRPDDVFLHDSFPIEACGGNNERTFLR
jgi:hypothetical protein